MLLQKLPAPARAPPVSDTCQTDRTTPPPPSLVAAQSLGSVCRLLLVVCVCVESCYETMRDCGAPSGGECMDTV